MPHHTTAIRKAEWALVALGLALLAAAALRPSIRGNDGVGHYVYLASLLRDGDLDFTNDYARFDALKQYPYKFAQLKRLPATGRPSDRYGIGSACFWAPLVAGTHLALKLTAPAQADAMGRPYEWAVGISTAFWGSLGLALLYGRLRRGLAPWGAGAVIGGLVLASPLGFYLYAHGSMSHGVGFFVAVMQLLAFERAWRRPAPWNCAWFGFWSAWIVMTRFQDATWVLVLGGALAWRVWRWARGAESAEDLGEGDGRTGSPCLGAPLGIVQRSRLKPSREARLKPALLGILKSPNPPAEAGGKEEPAEGRLSRTRTVSRCAPFIFALGLMLAAGVGFFAVFWLQMGVWKILYGSWFAGPMPYLDDSAGSFSRWPRHLVEVLFSGRKGVLAWHPLFALGLAGLVMMWRNGKTAECGTEETGDRRQETGEECGMRNAECGIGEKYVTQRTAKKTQRGAKKNAESGESGEECREGSERFIGAAGLAGFGAQLWLVSCWSIWWAGASFGNRFFISALPFIGLGLGRIVRLLNNPRRRFAAAAVMAVLVVWNMGLLVQYATEMIPREDWVPWSRIIHQNLVEVPRLIMGKLVR